MKKKSAKSFFQTLIALLLAAVAFACTACGKTPEPVEPEQPLTAAEVIGFYRDNVVEIGEKGSGIILHHDEGSGTVHIMTCLHVIDSPTDAAVWQLDETILDIDIRFSGAAAFKEYTATAIGFYRPYDMVVLSVAYGNDIAVGAINIDGTLAGGAGLRLGEKLYLLGSPENNGIIAQSGIVSIEETAVRLGSATRPVFGVSMPVFDGYSGGAVLDASGKIVGMAVGKLTSASGSGELITGYALPFNVLYALYTQMAAAPSNFEFKTIAAKVEISPADGLTLTVPLTAGRISMTAGREYYTVVAGVSDIKPGHHIQTIGGRAVSEGLFAVLETLAGYGPSDDGENVILYFNDSPCAVFKGTK